MIPLLLMSAVILIAGIYSGILTYKKLERYLDLTFKIQKTDDKKDIEEYSIKMSKVLNELIPWSMVYILCVVLFIIVLYALTT